MGPKGFRGSTMYDLAFLEGGGGMVCAERGDGKGQAKEDGGNSQNLAKLII